MHELTINPFRLHLPYVIRTQTVKADISCCKSPYSFILIKKNHDFIDLSAKSKGAKIMNRYNQVPHLTQDTNGKVTNILLEGSFFLHHT